jgi:hypothetical protein
MATVRQFVYLNDSVLKSSRRNSNEPDFCAGHACSGQKYLGSQEIFAATCNLEYRCCVSVVITTSKFSTHDLSSCNYIKIILTNIKSYVYRLRYPFNLWIDQYEFRLGPPQHRHPYLRSCAIFNLYQIFTCIFCRKNL